MDELPMAQGWAYYAWCIENDGWLRFCQVNRDSPGYVRQAVLRMMAMLENKNGK